MCLWQILVSVAWIQKQGAEGTAGEEIKQFTKKTAYRKGTEGKRVLKVSRQVIKTRKLAHAGRQNRAGLSSMTNNVDNVICWWDVYVS